MKIYTEKHIIQFPEPCDKKKGEECFSKISIMSLCVYFVAVVFSHQGKYGTNNQYYPYNHAQPPVYGNFAQDKVGFYLPLLA